MTATRSDALVFFGITGDLAFKKIFPALQAMIRHGHLDVPIVGVARAGWGLEQLKARARESLVKHGDLDEAAFATFCKLLRYVDGDYQDQDTYTKLREALAGCQRPLFYLAIPPSVFARVASGLETAGCARGARVVIEKPFGRDLASAKGLNRTLRAAFAEDAIFRIDHYLGKEPVQNLLYFRFANPAVEAGWDKEHIESVQITMAESFGVEGRGKFYEETGAIRDVVQNHMLHVIACLAMEDPRTHDQEAIRDARGRVLHQVRTLTPADVVRGQFRGYLQEKGVASDSHNETYAAARFYVDSERWRGVPFYVRAGKCLPVTATEVLVRFKPQPRLDAERDASAAGARGDQPGDRNHYRFQLSPDVIIALGAEVKRAGELMVGEPIELVACHRSPEAMDPYERLLNDAANGNLMLFTRQDSVEECWRIVDPVLSGSTPVHPYDCGTWGPAAAADKVRPPGGWHDPVVGGPGR